MPNSNACVSAFKDSVLSIALAGPHIDPPIPHAPKPISETFNPVLPNILYCILNRYLLTLTGFEAKNSFITYAFGKRNGFIKIVCHITWFVRIRAQRYRNSYLAGELQKPFSRINLFTGETQ